MRYHDTAMPRRRTRNQTSPPTDRRYEVELITGLERFVDDELAETLGKRAYRLAGYPKEGRMSFRYPGPVERLMALRSAVAVHLVERFDIPRPKALLGHQHFSRLVTAIRTAIGLHPAETFKTFRVSAAGTESTTMRRLRSEIGAAIRLDEQTDEAHLNLSVRRSVSGGGWEALVRLTPMPLSARKWRVCNRPDALNATVAHAMIALPDHSETDRFLNIGCGSGTLLVERLAAGPAASVLGLDLDPEAISCSERNLSAAGVRREVDLVLGDIHSPPLPDAPFDTAVADLPSDCSPTPTPASTSSTKPPSARRRDWSSKAGPSPSSPLAVGCSRTRSMRHTDRWRRTAEVPLRISFHRGYIAPSIYLLRRT